MKPLIEIGIIFVILGIAAIAIPSFTFFITERIADAGFFAIDVHKPYTTILNPGVGIAALVADLASGVIFAFRSNLLS